MQPKGLCREIGFLTVFFCFVWAAGFSWAGPDEGGWKKVKEAEGIRVFTRPSKGTALEEVMGVGRVNAPLEVVKEVWLDFASYPQWFGSCKEYRLLRTLSSERHHYLVYYVAASPPWAVGVSDRDAVLEVRTEIHQEKKKQIVIHLKALREPLVPIPPHYVRMTDLTGTIILTPVDDKNTHIVFSLRVDPGGDLPPRVIRQASINRPFDTIKGLRTMVKKDVYYRKAGISL